MYAIDHAKYKKKVLGNFCLNLMFIGNLIFIEIICLNGYPELTNKY